MSAPTFLSLLRAGATREQLEEWCRGKAQSYAVGNDCVMCRVLGKYLVCGHNRDIALTPHLALDGIWEPWVTMAIARYVKPGMHCMDVGACYGYYTVLMADIVGSAGFVQAWEPVWCKALRISTESNGFVVDAQRALMGTASGAFDWKVPDRGTFNAGDIKLTRITAKPGSVPMAAPQARNYDFIKIDVEGAEADVWEALRGVREMSPGLTVCMEFTPSQHEAPQAFLQQLMTDGFELGTVGHDGVPRKCSLEEALVPDTGGFRMLWLTRRQ